MPILSGSSCIMPVNKCQPKEQNGQKCTFWLMYIKPWMLYILNNGFFFFVCISLDVLCLPPSFHKDMQRSSPVGEKNETDNPQSQQTPLDRHRGVDWFYLTLWATEDINSLYFTSPESQHSWIESQPFKERRFRYFNTSHSCHLFFLHLSIWRLRDPPCPSKTICI